LPHEGGYSEVIKATRSQKKKGVKDKTVHYPLKLRVKVPGYRNKRALPDIVQHLKCLEHFKVTEQSLRSEWEEMSLTDQLHNLDNFINQNIDNINKQNERSTMMHKY